MDDGTVAQLLLDCSSSVRYPSLSSDSSLRLKSGSAEWRSADEELLLDVLVVLDARRRRMATWVG